MRKYFEEVYIGFCRGASKLEFFESIVLGMPIWLFFAAIIWFMLGAIQ